MSVNGQTNAAIQAYCAPVEYQNTADYYGDNTHARKSHSDG